MGTPFYKYQGTGNDFVMFDNRDGSLHLSKATVRQLCHRHFGIGADGLILLNASKNHDFEMKYYNSDGNESTMCGNGGRCLVQFAKDLGIISTMTRFLAIDGEHTARLKQANVVLGMTAVLEIHREAQTFFLNTGSPHHVEFTERVQDLDVFARGRAIRERKAYAPGGTNVNFVEILGDNTIFVRTYERGVEDETLSCGTGVVASAIAAFVQNDWQNPMIHVHTKGGELAVCFSPTPKGFEDIELTGPAKQVFRGEIEL